MPPVRDVEMGRISRDEGLRRHRRPEVLGSPAPLQRAQVVEGGPRHRGGLELEREVSETMTTASCSIVRSPAASVWFHKPAREGASSSLCVTI